MKGERAAMGKQMKPSFLISTCLSFDVSDKYEKEVYVILRSLGSYAKLFIKTMIYVSFAEKVNVFKKEDGKFAIEISDSSLKEFLSMYASLAEDVSGENNIYLNWKTDDKADVFTMMVLNEFGSGAKHLIITMFKDCYPFFYMKGAYLPMYKKRSHPVSKKQSAKKNTENAPALSKIPVMHAEKQDSDTHETYLPDDEELKLMDIITKGFDL